MIVWAQASLAWDLGDTGGTVAVRVPDHAMARRAAAGDRPAGGVQRQPHRPAAGGDRGQGAEPARRRRRRSTSSGPLGHPSDRASEQGPALPSSIVDATGELPLLVRAGAVSFADLQAVVPDLLDGVGAGDPEAPTSAAGTSTQEADGGG